MAHSRNGILLLNKAGQATDMRNNVDDSDRRYVEILCDTLSMKYKVGKTEFGTQ